MRSLATLLSHLEGCDRSVAVPAPSKFVDLIEGTRCFEHRLVLPPPAKGRVRARLGAALAVAVHAWRHRRTLVAIHANGLSERNVVALAALVARVPVVVWAHEPVSPWSRRLHRLLRVVNPETVLVAVSEYGKGQLVAAGLGDSRDVEVVPNPIDPDDLRHPAPRAYSSEAVPTVGYLGAPARYKGFHLLPEVIGRMRGERLHWVVFSGPRTSLPEVWAALESLESDYLTLEAKVVDVKSAYARCDIVYCPSLEETFGRVVAEAMANGIPVVASDLPTLSELLGNGAAGILVPPGDTAAAAEAIRTLAADPALRAELGRAGRHLASRYEPHRIAQRMGDLYGLRKGDEPS